MTVARSPFAHPPHSTRWLSLANRALAPAALGLLVVLAYARFTAIGFAGTDSLPLIETSRVLSWRDFLWQLSQPVMAGTSFTSGELIYRPVVALSFGADYLVFGLNAWGYHATNIAWHLLTTGAVYGILRAVGLARWSSMIGAAVFALHPTVVAAVPVIARRDNLVSAAAFCLALVCACHALRLASRAPRYALRYPRTPDPAPDGGARPALSSAGDSISVASPAARAWLATPWLWLVLALGLLAAALLSKEMAYGALPVVPLVLFAALAFRTSSAERTDGPAGQHDREFGPLAAAPSAPAGRPAAASSPSTSSNTSGVGATSKPSTPAKYAAVSSSPSHASSPEGTSAPPRLQPPSQPEALKSGRAHLMSPHAELHEPATDMQVQAGPRVGQAADADNPAQLETAASELELDSAAREGAPGELRGGSIESDQPVAEWHWPPSLLSRASWRQLILVCLLFVAVAALMFGLRFAVLGSLGGYAGTSIGHLDPQAYRHVLVTYARFLFWPVRDIFPAGSLAWLIAPSLLLVTLLIAAARAPLRIGLAIAVGCAWLFDFALFYALLKTFTGAWYLYFALPGASLILAAVLEWSLLTLSTALRERALFARQSDGAASAPRDGGAVSRHAPGRFASEEAGGGLVSPGSRRSLVSAPGLVAAVGGTLGAVSAAIALSAAILLRATVALSAVIALSTVIAVLWSSPLVQPYDAWSVDGAASARYLGAVAECARGLDNGAVLDFDHVPDYLDYPDDAQTELLTPTLVYEHTLTSLLRLEFPSVTFVINVNGYNHIRGADHVAVSCQPTPSGRQLSASS